MIKQISIGGMWEDTSWEISTDVKCESPNSTPCEHCHSFEDYEHKRLDGSVYRKGQSFICPKVVIAHNEGGYNSTGVYLDCIIKYSNL